MTAVNVSVKDQLSLSISIAVGGALVGVSARRSLTHTYAPLKQTALLIIPYVPNYTLRDGELIKFLDSWSFSLGCWVNHCLC